MKTIMYLIIMITLIITFVLYSQHQEQQQELNQNATQILELTNTLIEQQEEIIQLNNKLNKNKTIIYEYEDAIGELQELKEIWDKIGLNVEIFDVSFYAPLDNRSGICADDNPTSTFTGTYPTEGRTIAVDPTVIELGSQVWVEGFG